ncbi:hypothetical protein BT63DRAFT_459441 [Microthyrium microscopicum]|uniref:Uncharacterized protein n=1 Tax=Microthyrium microscopicum TaxID=703497 RepID=A0A6A6TXM3_9PEZI|nr:hypothetical protein BT63DRAFT_459441 [Microthyrium microscopicum]
MRISSSILCLGAFLGGKVFINSAPLEVNCVLKRDAFNATCFDQDHDVDENCKYEAADCVRHGRYGVPIPLLLPRADAPESPKGPKGGEGPSSGPKGGDGAQGEEGAQDGYGAQTGSGESSAFEPPPEIAPSVPSDGLVASSDGSLPNIRLEDDIELDDNPEVDENPGINEILPTPEYLSKGKEFYQKMLDAHVKGSSNSASDVVYKSWTDRYRLRQENRGPNVDDPEEIHRSEDPLDTMAHVLYTKTMADHFNLDMNAQDWQFLSLTSKGKPQIDGTVDTEKASTITLFQSKTEKISLVTFSDSKKNDLDVPGTNKLPNSELIYQLWGKEDISKLQYLWRHPIAQAGSVKMIQEAHQSKNIPFDQIATWTPADGDTWFKLLGTRNGRPGLFLATDHPGDMKCRGVVKIYTLGEVSSYLKTEASLMMELGDLPDC